MKIVRFLPIIIGLLGLLILSCVFIVDEREQALVMRFGRVDREITEPGIKFKLPPPFETRIVYEKRILPLETPELNFLPEDGKRRVVAAFARWRIKEMQAFREAVGDERGGELRLESILNDALGAVLGSEAADAVLTEKRPELLDATLTIAGQKARELGVEIVDIRIRTWFLPDETLAATYNRMQQDRNAVAVGLTAAGQEKARRIRATAEKQSVEIVAEANRLAAEVMGTADAERNAIFADAYGRDQEFFAFQRSLKAYEQSLKGSNSSIVLSPNSDFFEYLRDIDGASSRSTDRP